MFYRYTLLLFALTISAGSAVGQMIWDDFDNPEAVVYGFYDGLDFQQSFANPDMAGVNTSALCASYQRNPGVTFDVLIMDPNGGVNVDDLTDYVSGTKTISMKIYSPAAGVTVQITLEDQNVAGPTNYPAGRHSEYTATTTVANTWETITFTMQNQPDMSVANTSVNRLVLLFNPNTNTGDTYLWDDLMGPEFSNPCAGVSPDPDIIEDFECQRNLPYAFTNGQLSIVGNPNMAGINTSSTSGKFKKFIPPTNDGAFGGPLAIPFTTATYNAAHIDLYDPEAPREFLIIFQDGNNTDVIQETFVTSNTTDWQEFVVDLSSVPSSTSVENVVLLFNPTSATEDSIYFDNFTLSNTISVEEENTFEATTNVYPVPFTDNLYITSGSMIQDVVITDMAGKVLVDLSNVNQQTLTIDAAEFASGVYLITARSRDGQVLSRKLIK